jgi:hypothetical protein
VGIIAATCSVVRESEYLFAPIPLLCSDMGALIAMTDGFL